MRLTNKAEFYEKSRKLLLGNRLRQWNWEEFRHLYYSTREAIPQEVGMRYRNGIRHTITGLHTRARALMLGTESTHPDELLFDEGAPHHLLTLQGEVMTDERGLYVRYSTAQLHQRELWKREICGPADAGWVKHARGLAASALLQKYMDADSWDKLNEILATYEDAVVEFSAFSKPVGVLGWNTLFWEVRTGW